MKFKNGITPPKTSQLQSSVSKWVVILFLMVESAFESWESIFFDHKIFRKKSGNFSLYQRKRYLWLILVDLTKNKLAYMDMKEMSHTSIIITIMWAEVTYLVGFCPIMMDVWLISFISIYAHLYFFSNPLK